MMNTEEADDRAAAESAGLEAHPSCVVCAVPVEPELGRLGSLTCHSCSPGRHVVRAS
jgi:hypothetical protein